MIFFPTVPRYFAWTPQDTTLPQLYWNVYSNEQRVHAICRELGKIIRYADMLGVEVSNIAKAINDIQEGKLDEFITEAIAQWFEDNQPEIIQEIADINALIGNGFTSENTITAAIGTINTNMQGLSEELQRFEQATTDTIQNFRNEITADNWVTEPRIADGAVTTGKIADGAVTFDKISPSVVTEKAAVFELVKTGVYDKRLTYKAFRFPRSYTFRILQQSIFEATPIPQYLDQYKPLMLINGPLSYMLLSQGTVISELDTSSSHHWYVLGIKRDGDVEMILDPDETITASQMLANGFYTAFRGWSPIIANGVKFDWRNTIPNYSGDDSKEYIFEGRHARTLLGWNDDYWYVLTIEGQIPGNAGPEFEDMYNISTLLNIQNVFNMDGGGSSQVWTSEPLKNLVFQNKENYQADYRASRAVSMLEVIANGD